MASSSSYIGCFNEPDSFFASFQNDTSEVSAAICSRTCNQDGQGIFGLGVGRCACGGLVPDLQDRLQDSSCAAPCRDFSADPCGSTTGTWSIFYSNYTGAGPALTTSTPKQSSHSGGKKNLIPAIILPVAIVSLTIAGFYLWWRLRARRRGREVGDLRIVGEVSFDGMEKGEKSDFSPAVSSRNVTGARHSSSSQGGQPNRSSTSRPRSSSLPSERLVTPVPSTPSEPRESTHQPPSRTPSKNLRSLSIRLSRRLSASAKGTAGSDDSPRSEVKKPVAARRVKRRFGVGEEETTSEEGWQSDGEELDRRKVHRFSDHGHPFMSSVGQSRDSSMMSVSQQMTTGLDYFSIPPDPNGKNNFRRSMPPLGYDSLLQPSPFLGSSTPSSRQPSPNNTLAVRRNGNTPPPSSFLNNAALKRNNTWGHHVDQTWSDKNYLPSFTEPGPSSYGPYIPRDSSQRELLAYSPTSSNPPSGGVTPLNPSSPMLLARTGSSPFLEPMLASKPTTMKEKVASVDLLKRSDTLERLEREKKAILGKVDTSDDVSKPYITSSPKATPKKEGILKGGKNASRPATGDSDISVISNSIADDGASASNASGSHDLLLLKDPQPSANRVQFVDQPRLRVPSFPSIYSPRNPLSIQAPAKAHTPSSVLNSSDALSFNPFSLPPLSLERPSSSSTASIKLFRRPGRSSSESFAGPGQTAPFMAPFHTGKTVNSLGSLVSTVEREHSVPALGRQNLLLTNPDPPSTPTPTPDTLTRFHRKSTSTS